MLKYFKFWTQNVLPLVYDDSLSYYEVLCKISAKLNEVIKFVNDNIKEYIEEALNKLVGEIYYDEPNEAIVINLEVEDE